MNRISHDIIGADFDTRDWLDPRERHSLLLLLRYEKSDNVRGKKEEDEVSFGEHTSKELHLMARQRPEWKKASLLYIHVSLQIFLG